MSLVDLDLDERMAGVAKELIARGVPLERALTAFNHAYVGVALRQAHGSVRDASRKLGVHRNTLASRLRLMDVAQEMKALRVRNRRRS